jgi:8-oxo-dGTP pyrophosphatase MutT (NUDIX family)
MKVDSSSWRDPNDSDQVAQVYVLKDDRVLILQRSDWMAWAPNQWALPGGHIEIGEDFEKGAMRELKEETQLDVVSIEHFESDRHLHYYIVTKFEGKICLNNEHTGWLWVREEDLDHYDVVPVVKKRIKKLFNTMR